jgi:L-fucose isomerase
MQLRKKLTGSPVLFADVRHYHADRDIRDLCNSGQHLAAPGEMTLARLTRDDGTYRMQLMAGEVESYDDETNEALMRQSVCRLAGITLDEFTR